MAKSKIILSFPFDDSLEVHELIGEHLHFFYDPSTHVLSIDSMDHFVSACFPVEYFNLTFFSEV